MKQLIDLENWNRKEHFKFFSAFDDPFFGITTLVDFTNTYHQSKDEKKSFFLYSVHFLLQCVNEVEAFKLRIEASHLVYLYDIYFFVVSNFSISSATLRPSIRA